MTFHGPGIIVRGKSLYYKYATLFKYFNTYFKTSGKRLVFS